MIVGSRCVNQTLERDISSWFMAKSSGAGTGAGTDSFHKADM